MYIYCLCVFSGDYTGGGDPADKAKILKDNLEFQIYSIAIGESRKGMSKKSHLYCFDSRGSCIRFVR